MNATLIPIQPSKRPLRRLAAGAFHPSFLKFNPSTTPLSPETASLPVPDPANDATLKKQIPFRHLLRRLLMSGLCGLVSCVAPGGVAVSQPVPATVRARLRQPVPVVFVGLQDQVSYQLPVGSRSVFLRSVGDSQKIAGDIMPLGAHAGPGAALLFPFLAAAMVVPPLKMIAASPATVTPRRAEAAAAKLRSQAPPKNWGDLVRRTVVSRWAASGSGFSDVRISDAGMLGMGYDPLSREALAKAGGKTLLYLHVAGPGLTAEGDKINPRIAPSLLIYWKAIDTAKGSPLAQGTIAERSAQRKTLLQWARGNDQGLQTELENVIHRAATRLATELR